MRARAGAFVLLGVGAITVAIVLTRSGEPTDAARAAGAGSTTPTTTIRRQDLVEIYSADGTLGYADTRALVGRLAGTVTSLPRAGHVVRRDRPLYRVDDEPVILMGGRIPAYRALGPSTTEGADVRQLERSLRAAGHDPDHQIVIDRSWDAATTAAVRRWQDAHDLAQTGSIELGRIVFLPGRRRVATIGTTVGAPGAPGQVVLTTTSTRRQVAVALDTSKSAVARAGAHVALVLPSDEKVRGRIQAVGKVATAERQTEQAASSAGAMATIEVKVRLHSNTSALDQAPVTVRFEQSRRTDVLAIPVTALLARPGGRFAVQVVRAGGAPRVVTVRPGLYTSGYVEIAGAGLRPGQRVTNAAVQ